jgi:glutathione S-transferase
MPANMTLHSYVGCPFCLRAVLTAVHLGLPVKHVWITDFAACRTQEYLSTNPTGKVPILVTDNGIITESSVIMRYFSELATKQGFAGRNLFERAQVDEWLEYASNTSLSNSYYGVTGMK